MTRETLKLQMILIFFIGMIVVTTNHWCRQFNFPTVKVFFFNEIC